ncbi:MAG: DsbA family protein [Candidatus Diapherotrites archaeon]|nr:DsbA family protein [Candidatus Diapherotrites archaeon]
MTEKLYLPVSILLSALILSATMFLVGGAISERLSTGLVVAGSGSNTGSTAGTIQTAPTAPAPTQPSGGTVDMTQLIKDSHLIFGDPNAKVKIVEFSDFECPFCGRSFPTVKALAEKYGSNLAIYYAHFPLSFHPRARPSALASECAAEQGKFKEYHDKLFENQTALDDASLKKYSSNLGLDTAKFNQCLDSSKYAQKVDSDTDLGSRSGVSGTPTFFINGRSVVGAQPQSSFESVIDSFLS